MDIMGLSRRLFDQIGQTANAVQPLKKTDNASETKSANFNDGSALTERLDYLAHRFNVKSLPVSELIPLQEELKNQGFIQPNQVRAQGLLPQLAYHHYQSGPLDVEQALEDHIGRLQDKSAVLADYNEGNHLLNVVRNLSSAREQASTAA